MDHSESRFVIRPMCRADAREIVSWHYEPPYDFYDFTADPEDLAALLNPENWGVSYFSVYGMDSFLIGFFEFNDRNDAVEVGLGLRPDLTGKRLGVPFVRAGLDFAAMQFRSSRFRLKVATFNERAIRVYEKLGFHPCRTFDHETNGARYRFVEMETVWHVSGRASSTV